MSIVTWRPGWEHPLLMGRYAAPRVMRGESWTVIIDEAPNKHLSPNARAGHTRWNIAPAVAAAKDVGFKWAVDTLAKHPYPFAEEECLETTMVVFWPKWVITLPDRDNTIGYCKAYIDGIYKALSIDDSMMEIGHAEGARSLPTWRQGAIFITISQVEYRPIDMNDLIVAVGQSRNGVRR
jgi:hypothetical protein